MVDAPAVDTELAALLAGIADAVQQEAGMARAGIMGDYAARMKYARQHIKGGSLAGVLRGLKDERSAALAALARRTAQTMKGRLATAGQQHARGQRTKSQGPPL